MESRSTIKTYDEYYRLLEERRFNKRVEKVENQEDITNYYLENGELIFQYYDQKQNPNFMKKKRTSDNKKTIKKDSILYYLMKNRRKTPEEEQKEKKKEEEDKKQNQEWEMEYIKVN